MFHTGVCTELRGAPPQGQDEHQGGRGGLSHLHGQQHLLQELSSRQNQSRLKRIVREYLVTA